MKMLVGVWLVRAWVQIPFAAIFADILRVKDYDALSSEQK